MRVSYFMRIVAIASIASVAVLSAGLASYSAAPRRIDDLCAVFDQKGGWFEDDWKQAAEQVHRKRGVPVPVLMATLRKESGFQHNAKPPRTMLLGFIPWKRVSSAYGYSQALDGTWDHYQSQTGNWAARRTNFTDAIDFIGWYHYQNSVEIGIPLNDAYNLYLAYYSGPTGYKRGDWRSNGQLQQTAQKFARMAGTYQQQLQGCD